MPWRQNWIDPVPFLQKHTDKADLELREALKRRAYQVWISEIMLQQTRVETVKSYYESWQSRWPTIEDLADASPSDVLNAWKGLGYYSRATRIHTAAKKIMSDSTMNGLMPELPRELEAKVPGVGRYTAGAISSIVFGHAVPLLDGNVSRVLCRQTGLYANIKSKKTTDMLWDTAEQLVKIASSNVLEKRGMKITGPDVPKSDIPSFWNQALMEIGSTLCKPSKPDCGNCPIQKTCKAYAEGKWLAKSSERSKGDTSSFFSASKPKPIDIEDLCDVCEDIDLSNISHTGSNASKSASQQKQSGLSIVGKRVEDKMKQSKLTFRPASSLKTKDHVSAKPEDEIDLKTEGSATIEIIGQYTSLFPMKIAKKAVREEECVVCIIERFHEGESKWMIEQRPNKGLLANLWQFPSHTIAPAEPLAIDGATQETFQGTQDRPSSPESLHGVLSPEDITKSQNHLTVAERKGVATQYTKLVLQDSDNNDQITSSTPQVWDIQSVKDLGSLNHLFSHIKLTMFIYYFKVGLGTESTISNKSPVKDEKEIQKKIICQQSKWVSQIQLESENLSTGMNRCWMVLKKSI
jgi:A/G-specific adenine glycosylase